MVEVVILKFKIHYSTINLYRARDYQGKRVNPPYRSSSSSSY